MKAPRRMSSFVVAALLGAVVAIVIVAVITSVSGSDTSIWWWPATATAGVVGGLVLGGLFGIEAEGELPEEFGDATSAPAASDKERQA
jgi:peptidoglycan/LPS O-acetylase OafA/YrhL